MLLKPNIKLKRITDIKVELLKKHNIKNCYFGHMHGQYNVPRTTEYEGINFTLISSDFLDFIPMITMPFDY